MDAVTKESVALSDSKTSQDIPAVIQPWEDFAAVMQQANRARAAGDLQRACTFYTRAIDLDPNSAQAWAGRASTTENLDEAIVSWGYALALAPDGEARAMLGACVSEKIKQSEAEQAASFVRLGRSLTEAGHWPWAYRLFVRATELAPSNEEAWIWRAGVSGDTKETTTCLRRALELNPQNAQASAGLRWIESKQAATPAPVNADQAAIAFEEGQRELQTGDRGRAYDRFVRATDCNPRNASAWFWRGSTAPDLDEALACMDRVLEINPADEAAKDARWWLRVQKLRERGPALASPPPTPPTINPYAARYPRRRRSIFPIWAALFLAMVLFGLVSLLVVIWFGGLLK